MIEDGGNNDGILIVGGSQSVSLYFGISNLSFDICELFFMGEHRDRGDVRPSDQCIVWTVGILQFSMKIGILAGNH